METAWHTSGGSGSKGTGPPGGSSSNAAAGTAGTPDTAMVLHGGESGPATPGTSGSGPIPELPFATALLTSSDYKLDAGGLGWGGARCGLDEAQHRVGWEGFGWAWQRSTMQLSATWHAMSCHANPPTADPSTGKPILLGSGHFANVYRGVYGAEPAAIKARCCCLLGTAGSDLCWAPPPPPSSCFNGLQTATVAMLAMGSPASSYVL